MNAGGRDLLGGLAGFGGKLAATFDGSPNLRLTSRKARTLQPQSGASSGGPGVYIGRDLLNGCVYTFDPFEAYKNGTLANPAALVFGDIGSAKSALVKTYILRQQVFGRRAVITDPKGEYGPLAAAMGVTPIRLEPGGRNRLNPLDAGGVPHDRVRNRRLSALRGLAEISLRRPLDVGEPAALAAALDAACDAAGSRAAGEPVIGDVARALFDPSDDAAASQYVDRAGLAALGLDVARALHDLCTGEWAGMFDGPTTAGLDLDADLVVFDLSALNGSVGQQLMMHVAAERLHTTLTGARVKEANLIMVEEESWSVLKDPQQARALERRVKLARSYGVQNVMVMHKLSDLSAVGKEGSEHRRIVEGLLADSATKIVYRQDSSVADATRLALGLSGAEMGEVARLMQGQALWKVAGRTTIVEHDRSRFEVALTDTDAAMTLTEAVA